MADSLRGVAVGLEPQLRPVRARRRPRGDSGPRPRCECREAVLSAELGAFVFRCGPDVGGTAGHLKRGPQRRGSCQAQQRLVGGVGAGWVHPAEVR